MARDNEDDYWERFDDRIGEPRKRGTACRCGDMPGRCPGPSNCPLCEPPDELPDGMTEAELCGGES